MAGVAHLKRIWKNAGAIQETCPSEMLGGQGADFLRRLHFGASDFRFAKMILRDRCSTSYDLEKSQNALVRGRQLCAQLSILEGSLAELFRF